jgi:hypothetical protein
MMKKNLKYLLIKKGIMGRNIYNETDNSTIKTIEIHPSKTLKINTNLTDKQEHKLLVVLKKHIVAFAWDYKEMKGIHPSICTHHIYIK